MNPKIELSLLGAVRITLDGEEISRDIPVKSRALLCYLAVMDRPYSREKLAGLLWRDSPQDRAQASLRKSLWSLRKLSDTALTITRHTVAFNRDGGYWLDVEVLESAMTEDGADVANLQALREAVDLYRGEFLEGFSVRQAVAFEEWVLGERERLRQLVIQALHRLSVTCTDRGEVAAGIEYTTRLLALEPWQEEAHRQLMLLLAHSGQQSAALAQYETCRQILAEELGVEPLPETQALYHRLKTRRGASPDNLPPQTTPFVGRQAELAQIAQLLGRADCRLFTLIGAGGIGKTRLAIQAARQALDTYAGGVYFVRLSRIHRPEFLVPAIIEAIGCRLSGKENPKRQLLKYLQPKEMLLVLDNFEHLLSAPDGNGRELMLELLGAAPKLKLLVTSRERLNLQSEWLLTLQGLPYPPAEAPFGEASFEAVELFVQGARRVQPEFSLPAEWPGVVRICRLLDGMPLGIELAATWVSMMPCAEIVLELARGLDLLSTTLHDVPARHRSMAAVFDHSWQLLSDPERQVFKKLTVFRGGFDRRAAGQVAGASLTTLATLVDKSLLRVVSPGRYDMLEPLKQYAAGKLAEAPTEEESVRDRHRDYYATLLKRFEEDLLGGATQGQAVAEIMADIDNIRSSWSRAAGQGNLEAIVKSQNSLLHFHITRGWHQEGKEAFQEAVDGIAGTSGDIDQLTEENRKVLGQVLARQGWFHWHLGQYREARKVLRQSLACLRHGMPDTRVEEGAALCQLGMVEWFIGDHGKAKSLLHESLAIGKQHRDLLVTISSLTSLSNVARSLGAYAEAEKLCHEGIALCQNLNNRRFTMYFLNSLAWAANAKGDHAQARQWLQEVLVFHKETSDRALLARTLTQVGTAAYLEGEYAEAKQRYLESVGVSKESGEPWHTALALIGLGYTTCALGEYEVSGRHFRGALQTAMDIGSLWTVMDSLVGLAGLLAASAPGEAAAEQGVELLAFVLQHPATTQEARDRAAPLLTELEGRLSTAAVAAAKARGQARDLEEIVRQFMPS